MGRTSAKKNGRAVSLPAPLIVEGFFELFVTVLVAVTFYQLGVVRRINVVRVICMDAILFLAGGIIGTAHHWYWTGQANFTMAQAAMFSALEVVPLTLLALDAWDFITLTGTGDTASSPKKAIPHKLEIMMRYISICGQTGCGRADGQPDYEGRNRCKSGLHRYRLCYVPVKSGDPLHSQ